MATEHAESTFCAIETQRLLLRDMRASDADDLYEYASDEETARYMMWPTYTNKRQAEQYTASLAAQYGSDALPYWAIEWKESGKMIGGISLADYDAANLSISFGYTINRAFWNRGITTEALGVVIDFAFSKFDIERIESRHVKENAASGRVMLKCGLQFEGILRKKRMQKGELVDLAFYSILREEWAAAKQADAV